MKDFLTIGEVSKITGLPISTLRYYDAQGIISPNYKDENTNYRYYRFFQIPVIKMIVHLKKLGFSNAKIKSHLDNMSYSHTLKLLEKMREQTRNEILRLENLEKELEENELQMKYLIHLEKKTDEFFVEEEEIRGIYVKLNTGSGYVGVSKAFREIDDFLITKDQVLLPMGMVGFTITKENVEKRNLEYDRLIFMKDFESFSKRFRYPQKKYICLVCQSKFPEVEKNLEKVMGWVEENGKEVDGDSMIHILSGPAFEKDPSDAKYVIRVPFK